MQLLLTKISALVCLRVAHIILTEPMPTIIKLKCNCLFLQQSTVTFVYVYSPMMKNRVTSLNMSLKTWVFGISVSERQKCFFRFVFLQSYQEDGTQNQTSRHILMTHQQQSCPKVIVPYQQHPTVNAPHQQCPTFNVPQPSAHQQHPTVKYALSTTSRSRYCY